MKKFFAMFLAMLLIVFSLTACTRTKKETPDNGDSQEISKPEPEKTTFEELTVADNEECVLKITGIKENSMWGYTLNAYLENKSSEKTYMFSVKNASINGVTCDPLFAKEVISGKKTNADITFLDSAL